MVENKQEPAWDEPAGAQKLEAVDGDHIAVIDGRLIFHVISLYIHTFLT